MKKDIWDRIGEHLEDIIYLIGCLFMFAWVVFCCWWLFIDSDLSLLVGLFLFMVLTGFLCVAMFLIGEPLAFLILVALGVVYALYKLLVMLWRGVVGCHRRHDK
ncbi:hypothetical protein HQS50_000223 [Salmonella enterica]|nr:hypothetical protein [Salmonella enterica]